MSKVEVNGQTWTLGESIGTGGFGQVFVACSDGEEAVIKLVPKDPGAERELLLGDDVQDVPNVIPLIASGETTDSWVLVMPRAEMSLRQYLTGAGRALDRTEALPILIDIAQALVGLVGLLRSRMAGAGGWEDASPPWTSSIATVRFRRVPVSS